MPARESMANRFARKIKSGEIGSIEELKSEFKELAKLTHPDLSAGEGTEGAFVAVRAEYEAALRDFEKHRFGARGEAWGTARGEAQGARPQDAPSSGPTSTLSDSAWPCLELLLKRGFPKRPRHEKEALRYEYARWRLEQALGNERAELFRAFESSLLDMKAFGSTALGPVLRFLVDLIDYRYAGLPAMRTNVVLSLGRLEADRVAGAFLSELAAALGIGGEIGASE